jgi:peptidase, S41 family
MKINKKKLIMLTFIAFLGYVTYSEEKVKEEFKKVQAEQRANAVVDLKNINKLIQTVNYINERWVGNVDTSKDKLYEAALRGMVKSLEDPYSEYLTAKELQDLNEGMDGVYGGVGMSIRKEKGDYMEVISPFVGTPAFRAGIQIGDIITQIDGEDTLNLTATEMSKKLKGEPGTKVKVEIYRKGMKKPLEITLTREIIKLENVEYKVIDKENKIGYISLLNFGSKTGPEIKNALIELEKQGVEKLIFDLRTNPGGSLQEAIEIASQFVSEDLIVTLKTKSGNNKEYKRVGEQIFKGPMTVLVNRGSASASEIVTGVLKDYKRATIIGEKTFGKGVAQGIYNYPGSDDAIKLTIAEYATPKNNNINKNGIEPDIYINMNNLLSTKGYSSETKEALENREKEIKKLLVESEGEKKAEEIIKKGDVQLKAAIDVLLGKEVKSDPKPENTNKNKKTKKDLILEEANKK